MKIFLLISKQNEHVDNNKETIHLGTQEAYNGYQKALSEIEHKKLLPYPDPTQSAKLVKDIDPSTIYILTHNTKLLRKEHFKDWTSCSSFSNSL